MSERSSEITKFLRRLRAVRDYTPDAIADDILQDILEVGRWSGSASNVQPTEIVVVRDAAIRQKMAENGARPAAGAPVALVIVTPGGPERHDVIVFDEGRLAERLLLAANAHGLGGNIATLKEQGPEVIRTALGIPADRRVVSVVTIGHGDEEARKARPRRPGPVRKPIESFVHWDHY